MTRVADPGLTDRLEQTLDGLQHLAAEHVRLAKLELRLAGRELIRQAALAALVAALLAVGHLLLCAALSAALAPALGLPLALSLVGGGHVAPGLLGLLLVRARLQGASRTLVQGTVTEVGRSVLALGAASTGAART